MTLNYKLRSDLIWDSNLTSCHEFPGGEYRSIDIGLHYKQGPLLILNASVLVSGMSLMWLTLDTAFGENFPTCERSFLQVGFKANILSLPFVLED